MIAPAIATAVALALAEGAYAADAAASDSGDQLTEVVVTAEKRAENIQTTAASITAVSAQDITDRGIVDFNTLAQSVAGISMRTSGPGQTEFEMRGLNSAGGNTSQVGFYFDETPLSSPASSQLGKEESSWSPTCRIRAQSRPRASRRPPIRARAAASTRKSTAC
jgi:iron complex outermembrane receptor protein